MSDFEVKKLKEITIKIGSGATPRGGGESYKLEGISLIRSQNVLDFKLSIDGIAFIDDAQAYELRNVIIEEKDVLLNITGDSVARCCMASKTVLPARVNQHVAIIRVNPKVASPEFVMYNLLYNKESLLSISEIGATRRAITKGMIEEFEIALPSLSEQHSIASVLSSLDDKIDLLHRQNKTLEQMAETLFRQWFVEEVKNDWIEKPLDQIAEYLNGLALQKFPPISGEPTLPAIKIREMNQGITDSTDIVSANIPEKYIIEDGDILFSWSGSLDVIIWSGGKGALNQHLFKVSSSEYPKWLIYFATRMFLPEFRDIANDKATTMGHIQRAHLTQATLKIPPKEDIQLFDEIISGLFDKIIINKKQITVLETTRDTLLPKLMNGTIRVANN